MITEEDIKDFVDNCLVPNETRRLRERFEEAVAYINWLSELGKKGSNLSVSAKSE